MAIKNGNEDFIEINGSYFKEDFTPDGLVVSGGIQHGSESNKSIYGGFIGQNALQFTIERRLHKRDYNDDGFIVQSGPFLIEEKGKAAAGLDDYIKADRTAVGVNDQDIFIIHAIHVTLKELADTLSLLDVHRAINLDGGPSSALIARTSEMAISRTSSVKVPYYLVFIRK